MRKRLRALQGAAETSISIKPGARLVSTALSFLVKKLHLIKQHIRSIDGALVRLVDETGEGKYLLSITGLIYICRAWLFQVLTGR